MAVEQQGPGQGRLETGRGSDRRRFVLGFLTDVQAQRALESMNREEETTADTSKYGRVHRLHETNPEAAIEFLVTGHEGVDPFGPEPVNHSAMLLRDYFDQFYREQRAAKRGRTWASEEGHWRRIIPALGHLKLREVNAHVVADYVDGLMVRDGAQPASGNTKRLHRAAVQALLDHAFRQRHLPEKVELAVFRIEGSTRPVNERRDPLSIDELVRLLDACSPKLRAIVAVAAGEGLRPSEVTRLRWEDVGWADRTLGVRGDDRGRGKTALSVATIPMTPIAHRELQAWWIRLGQPTSGIMFTADAKSGGEAGAGYKNRSAYRSALKRAGERAGIGREVNIYLLRSSFATIAWSLGIDKDVAWRILRHANPRMIDEVYCRPRPADLVAKVAAFDIPGSTIT